MKNTIQYLTASLCGLQCVFAIGAHALEANAAPPAAHENFRPLEQLLVLPGKRVLDSENKSLGRIKDIAIDLEHGRIVELIMVSGGFLGFGETTFGVPPGALTLSENGEVFVLNMNKQAFKEAPKFPPTAWAEHWQSGRVATDYRFYKQEPYFAQDGHESRAGNTAVEPLGYIQIARRLIDLPVKNRTQQSLGSVYSILFDLQHGRVIHVVIEGDGFRGITCMVQPSALKFNAAHDALTLDIAASSIANQPRILWSQNAFDHYLVNPTESGYQQEPYTNRLVGSNDGVNTRQNVNEGSASYYTPLAQGASFDDVDLTHRIYAAIHANPSLSQNAGNIEVGTRNGRITLRGHVNTEAGKTTIGEIAGNAGRPENVSNLLEVRPITQTP